MPLAFLFDFDQTLSAYDNRRRIPALAEALGVSQYRMVSTWWAGGHERRAEAGEFPDAAGYLDAFARVTGGRRMSADEWVAARRAAMTPIDGSIAALRHAATLGEVWLLSNNPGPFGELLPRLAPEVASILGDHVLTSATLGVRKPDPEVFRRAVARIGVEPGDAFFADDNAANADGATEAGLTGHHFTTPRALRAAIDAFADGRSAARR